MARLGALRLGLALALLVLTVFEHVASEDKCRSGCQGNTQTFKYAEGTTYKYNLEGSIDVTLSNAEGQQSSTKLKATVLLTQLPQCNQLLRLQNVQIIGPDAKKYGNIADIGKPIRINFHDGQIQDSICAEPGDSQNSLNIKRAVASLFQASLKQHYETDVFGVCPTEIVTRKEGANLVIQKSRHLNKCSHRESIKQDFMATAFNLNSEIKSSPILNGDYTSEQKIKNGVLDHAVVTEHYLYVPFSVGQNGAKATVSTKLQFAGSSKEAPANKCAEPKSIIFENPHLVTADKSNADNILSALKDTKNNIDVTVGETTAKAFVNLIKIVRASKKDDILAVYGQVRAGAGFRDKVGAKKVFLDALFRAGTGDTIEVAIELLKNKELSPIEQKLVFLGLAFVKHATLPSLAAATALLDQPNLPREAYLGVGTLAGRYCREHSCENVAAVNQLTQKLVSKLKDGKAANRQQENEFISVLKALANIETLSDNALAKVAAIAQDKKAANRLRVAALETFLTDACSDKVRDSALNILKDVQQDSEIRIKAYLVVAQCPNGKIANALKALLDNEPSHQVGGFIVSHLRNLKASANPDKELAKHQLSQVSTTKKFPIDLRKYSFNNEYSYTVDTLGLASSVEGNVIYSQESFWPRSGSMNLTAQIFGHNFNFLEIGTRQENLDRLLEHYFGPLGVLRKASADELVSSGKASLAKVVEHFKQRLSKTRGRRDVSKADIDNIGKQVHIKDNNLNTDLDLDLSVKLFGSELLFLSVNDQTHKFSPDSLIDNIFDCLDDGINKAKNFEKAIQSNVLFIDSEFSYPTSLGFPLRLSVEGSSSVQIKAAGRIDVRALLKQESAPLKISLIPSANIDITGSLTVDAQVVEGGLKVTSSLFTATGGDLEILISDNGKGVDVKFSLPVENQKLVSVNHEIVFNIRELGKPEVNQPIKFGQNKDFSVCMDQLSPFIGLAFCVDINNPSVAGKQGAILPFPLSGNAKFSVGIHREDVSQYHYKRVLHSEQNKLGAEITLETIGARNDKKLSLQVEAFVVPEPYIKATLVSPIKSASVEGRIINNNQEKSLSVQLSHDNQKYLGKIGVSVSGNAAKAVYKPLVQYDGPGPQGQKLPLSVEGQIVVEHGQNSDKYTFDNVRVISANQKAFSIQGNLGREGGGFFSDVTVSDGVHSGSLKGKIQVQPDLLKLNAEVKNSYNPQANVNIKYELKRQPTQLDSNLQLIHGPDLSSKTNKLTLSNSVAYRHKSADDFEARTSNKLSYPLLKADAKFDYAAKPKTLNYDLELQYGELKLGSELDAKVSQKAAGDYDIEFEIYGLDNKLELNAKREVTGDKSKIEKSLDINGKKFEVSGTVTHHCKLEDVNVGADLVIKIPGRAEAFKLQNGFVRNANELDTHLKISSGSNVYVDAFLKGTKGGNANGSLKITLKDFFLANGQIRASNGAGTANIVVELVKFQRKLKAESSFTIAAPTYNVALSLYSDFEKDNSKKLVFDTKNQIKSNSVDSKNSLDVVGKKLELNFKGALDGAVNNGKLEAEAELTLPSQVYFAYKLNRELRVVNSVANGNMFISLEQRDNKNTPGRKINLKAVLKDANLARQLYDVTYNLAAENGQGKNLNADVALKRQLQGDHVVVDAQAKLHGSVLSTPLEGSANALYKDLVGSYKGQLKYGPKASLAVNGKYDLNYDDKEIQGDINVELSTPSATVHVVKFSASGLVAKPQDELKLKGSVALFVDDNGANPDATVNIKLEGEALVAPNKGQLKGAAHLQKEDPISVDLGYTLVEEKQANGHLSVNYAKGKAITADLSLVKPSEHEYKVDFKLDSPQAPGTRLEVGTKRSPDGKVIHSEVALTADKKRFVLTNELTLSEITPGLDVKLVLPNGRVDRILAKLNRVSEKQFGAELKIVFSENNFAFDSNVDANVENVDDFFIKVTTNSPALKLDNVVIEAQNKPAKGGKRIQVSIKSAGKNVLSGSTSYKAREEGGKYIVEGSGTFKVKEENKQANFKFIRQTLNTAKNGEDGVEISFNAGLGNKAVDAELKVSNKQLRVLNSYCEEKKQCAHVEIDSKTINANAGEFNHELEIAVDLRKLGLSHEFGLKGVTTRKSFVLDHTVDIYFQSKENKYQYSLFVHPSEAGAQLTTPKRVIAIEGRIQGSRKGNAPIKGELAFYLDKKNQPNQKTALVGVLNCQGEVKVASCNGEIKFTNPALGKDLSVSYQSKYDSGKRSSEYNLVIDVFPNPNQKIIVSGKAHANQVGSSGLDVVALIEAKSQGLNVDIKYEEQVYLDATKKEFKYSDVINYNVAGSKYDSGIVYEVNPQQATLSIKALNKELVNANSKIQLRQDNYVADTELHILGVSPISSHLEIKNLNSLTFSAGHKATPNDHQITIQASLIPGQIAKFQAKSGANELAYSSVKLDEANFLKSESRFSSENIQKHVFAAIKKDIADFLNELKAVAETASKDANVQAQKVVELLRKNAPNLKPLRDYYQKELQKLREELVSDKTLKEVGEFLRGIFGAVANSITEVLSRVSEITEKVAHTVQQQFGRVIELINKEIVPKLTEIAHSFVKVGVAIFEQVADLAFTYLAKVSLLIEAHQAELNQIATTVSAIAQDFGRLVYKLVQQARIVVNKEWSEFYDGVKKLPIAEELKIKYEQLFSDVRVPNALIHTLKEVLATIKDAVPSQDAKKLITVVGDYLEKKLRRESVDDVAAIQNIIKLAVEIINKVFSSISANKDLQLSEKSLPSLSFDFLRTLPRLAAVRFSPISYIAYGEIPSLVEILYALSLNPRHWIPPYKLDAVVVQGQHIFTFDGKHLTFPGNCNYLLARDAVNGNFSIVGTFTNGLLTAITVADKTDAVTLKKGGLVLLNNAATEFPVRKPELEAYRLYESINIWSKAGVEVVCGPELLVCGIHVSGFYHAQLRGLLGNGNSEPYDDYTLPNGKIVTSESDFGNAYKVAANCAPVKTVDHSVHHHNPACNKLFGQESPLRICYKFVNPENYRTACDHGLAAGVKDTEKAITIGYVASCRSKFVPVRVPAEFVKCENGEQSFGVGDTFSTKVPAKAADIVVIVDQVKSNEAVYKDLVQPIITQITTELSSNGITDIEFHLVGYGGEYQSYPSHYTVAGKMTFKGRSPNLKFTEEPKEKPVSFDCEHTDRLVSFLRLVYDEAQLITGQTLQQRTYTQALKYPFRAHAVKSIVAVVGQPCERGNLLGLQKLRALLLTNNQISLNLVTPFDHFVAKDAKQTKNVIGFNAHNVFTFSDAKKKPEGSHELYGELDYDDYCVDFTIKNRGNVFVTNNFVQAKGPARKQFAQIAAHNIVEQLVNVEQGLDCECKLLSPYTAQNVCKVSYSKDRPVAAKKGAHKG